MEVISGLRVVVNMLGLVDCDGVVGFLLVVLDYLGVDVTGDPVAIGWAALHMLLSALAICASLIGFVLPRYTTMVEIENDGAIGERSSLPYVAAFFNCFLGAMYAKDNWLTGAVNIFGAICFFGYFIKFLQFCQAGNFDSMFIFPAAGSQCFLVLFVYYWADMEANFVTVSWVYALWKGLVAVLPLQHLGSVYADGNMQRMPSFLASCTAFVNAALGVAVALTAVEFDGFVFWPCCAGLISAALQVFLHIVL